MQKRLIRAVGWLLGMLILAFSIRNIDYSYESIRGDLHVFAYKPWVPVLAFLGGLAFSIWLYKNPLPRNWIGPATTYDFGLWGAITFMILTIGVVLELHSQVIEVGESGFIVKGGFADGALLGTKCDVSFNEVTRIRTISEKGGGRSHGEWRSNCKLLVEKIGGDLVEFQVKE